MVKSLVVGARQTWLGVPALLFSSCVTLGKLLHLACLVSSYEKPGKGSCCQGFIFPSKIAGTIALQALRCWLGEAGVLGGDTSGGRGNPTSFCWTPGVVCHLTLEVPRPPLVSPSGAPHSEETGRPGIPGLPGNGSGPGPQRRRLRGTLRSTPPPPGWAGPAPVALPPPGWPRGLAGERAAPSTPASPAAGRGAKPAAGRRRLCSASLRALRRG